MIIPQRDIVLIKADKATNRTRSGLLLSEEWKTLPLVGTVLACGPAVNNLQAGDRVIFERYATIILEDDQRLCLAGNVFGVIKDEPTA